MQTGDLKHEITFQRPVESRDRGAVVITYATDSPPDTVFAKVLSERGSEAFESARVNARETVRACVRYRDDVVTKWRFLWRGRAYYVKRVDDSQKEEGWLWVTAECTNAP